MIKNVILDNGCNSRVVSFDGIEAVFLDQGDNSVDVLLSINSQKFLINFTDYCGFIENFQILSARGFVTNMTNGLVSTLKSVTEVMRSMS